ncbi:oligosaccharide flippase family protein [Saprospira sp. CCB-QB6]|uniref:polysaccharide biosynthesis C-terminal domain-containing protein n=1 Tax=Saprospira sp. CCB-QB6 TaxID=3023936 RepID=UPI002349FC35|nr:polysaccharide biosynthesis C-terminal domain-containing protein [Saprospira sp. CCB-QB6]WCL81224.1 oligosaccharide flippase family protein [Saprospira sp. CCB-QB6]
MKKTFLLNLALLVGINLLIKPFYIFGIDLQVQNRLDDGEYGLYFSLFNFAFIFQLLADLGLLQFNSRFISQQENLRSAYLPSLLSLKAILGLSYFALAFGSAFLMGYTEEAWQILPYILLNQFLLSGILFLRSNLSAMAFYRLDSLLSALDKLLLIILLYTLLALEPFGPFNILQFVQAQSLGYALTFLVCAFFLAKKIEGPLRWKISPKRIYILLKQALPYAFVVLLMTLYSRMDAVMIERLLPIEKGKLEADQYAFAYRLLDAFNMIAYLFAGLLLPMFSRLLRPLELKDLGQLMATAFRWMSFLSLSLSIALFFYADELAPALYESSNSQTPFLLQILLFSANAAGIIYIFGTFLTAAARLKEMNIFFAFGVLLNFGLNFFWIPAYGALGAAVATLITQFFIAVTEIFLTFRYFPNLRNYFSLALFLRFILGSLLSFGIFYSSQFLPFIFWFKILLAGAASLLSAFLIGQLSFRELLELRK